MTTIRSVGKLRVLDAGLISLGEEQPGDWGACVDCRRPGTHMLYFTVAGRRHVIGEYLCDEHAADVEVT